MKCRSRCRSRIIDALRSVLDAIPQPIFIKDDQLRFVVMNRAMCELMGHPHERLVGKTDHDFVPKEHADVFQRVDRLVLETGEVNENEELIPGAHGEIRTIVTRKKRACLANGARLVVGSITDISELKQREASSRLLFDSNPCRCGYSSWRACGFWRSTRPPSSTTAIRASSSWR